MANRLSHRGPDGEGFWIDESHRIALGHRRLSIFDLTDLAAQPMKSHSGRYIISFNGEIYNFLELKEDLRGVQFKSKSDTEVLLSCIETYGLKTALQKVRGMFAFGLIDLESRSAFLVRDRTGEKPLFLWRAPRFIAFASELSAFSGLPDWKPEIETSAVECFFQLGFIHGQKSIYKNVERVQPGEIVRLDLENITQEPKREIYWALPSAKMKSSVSYEEAKLQVSNLIDQSVKEKLRSDVPTGILLSGGIDSSLVLSAAAKFSAKKIETFTIGFDRREFDESYHAKEIATHYKTNHHEMILKGEDILQSIESVWKVYDEPFSDSSQIPTQFISKYAREFVTVAIGGDGGDELFCGYPHHQFAPRVWNLLRGFPLSARIFTSQLIERFPSLSHRTLNLLSSLILKPGETKVSITEKIQTLTYLLQSRSSQEFYRAVAYQDFYGHRRFTENADWADQNFTEQMLREDFSVYLPGDILTKVDRASMSVGLETRAPLLDHRLIELAFQLPIEWKSRDGGKGILKSILADRLPEKLWRRPKSGFRIPLAQWLRGPLSAWAHERLRAAETIVDPYLGAKSTTMLWDEFQSRKEDHSTILWRILSFSDWHSRNMRLKT